MLGNTEAILWVFKETEGLFRSGIGLDSILLFAGLWPKILQYVYLT